MQTFFSLSIRRILNFEPTGFKVAERTMTMRKREFVGVGAVIGVFCTIIGFAAYRKGSRNGFMKGYKDADKLNNTKL